MRISSSKAFYAALCVRTWMLHSSPISQLKCSSVRTSMSQ